MADARELDKRLTELSAHAAPAPWEMIVCEDGLPLVATAGDIMCAPDPNHEQPDSMDYANFALIAYVRTNLAQIIKALAYAAERERLLAETQDCVAALLQEPNARLRPYVAEAAIKAFRERANGA
jgi:hypothetical protein